MSTAAPSPSGDDPSGDELSGDELEPVDEGPIRAGQLRDASITGLFLLAVFYTLFLARVILMPLVVAVVIKLLLTPVVLWLRRHLRVPCPLGAFLVLGGVVGVLVLGGRELVEPAQRLIDEAPEYLDIARTKLARFEAPLEPLQELDATVEELTSSRGGVTVRAVVERPSTLQLVLDQGSRVMVGLVIVLMLSYFMLASGHAFLAKLVRVLSRFEHKRRAVECFRQIEEDISHYLLTITLINILLGTSVGLGLWLLGLPEPLLWGVLVTVVNFAPYVGPLVGVIGVGLAAVVQFDSTAAMLAPPALYLGLNTIEAYVVTPFVLGRSLSLSAVVVLTSVVVWSWLWGMVGAILAVPLIVIIKIVCANIPPWRSVATFLE